MFDSKKCEKEKKEEKQRFDDWFNTKTSDFYNNHKGKQHIQEKMNGEIPGKNISENVVDYKETQKMIDTAIATYENKQEEIQENINQQNQILNPPIVEIRAPLQKKPITPLKEEDNVKKDIPAPEFPQTELFETQKPQGYKGRKTDEEELGLFKKSKKLNKEHHFALNLPKIRVRTKEERNKMNFERKREKKVQELSQASSEQISSAQGHSGKQSEESLEHATEEVTGSQEILFSEVRTEQEEASLRTDNRDHMMETEIAQKNGLKPFPPFNPVPPIEKKPLRRRRFFGRYISTEGKTNGDVDADVSPAPDQDTKNDNRTAGEKSKEEGIFLDEDVRQVLLITDDLLGKLPDDVIENFATSKDFELYERVMRKYNIK